MNQNDGLAVSDSSVNAEMLQQVQKATRTIMEKIISICDRHDIHYYLVEGTLLGAVRHNGFIPWDDDADIAIPISAMQDFVRHCKDELPESLYVEEYFTEKQTPEIVPDLTRICNKSFKFVDYSGYNMDLYVDIPVLIGLPDSPVRRKIYYYILMLRKFMVRVSRPEIIHAGYWTNKGFLRKTVILLVRRINFSKVFPYEKQLSNLNRWMNKYPFEMSRYAFLYPSAYKDREIVPQSWYGSGVQGTFEGMKVRLPAKYHKLLTNIYGDYMQFPPVEKRTGSHVQSIIATEGRNV